MDKTIAIVIGSLLVLLGIIFLYLSSKTSTMFSKISIMTATIVSISSGMALIISKTTEDSETSSSTPPCPPGQSCQSSSGGGGTDTPPGSISAFGGTSVPSGWLLCDGTAYSSSNYGDLFNAIGTSYGTGGNNDTDFNVPDLRGMFLRGFTGTTSNDPDASSRKAMNGGNTGNNIGSYQPDAFAVHTHTSQFVSRHQDPVTSWTTPFNILNTDGSGSPVNTNPAGGAAGNSSETRPKNVYVNFIIKT